VKRALLVGLFVAPVVAGCRVTPPRATPADAQRGNVELAQLQEGRALMVTKCGNCHQPPLPKDHAPAEWPHQLDEMAVRANLDVKQRFLIEQYFVVMSTR
jgi:hypothetical protein